MDTQGIQTTGIPAAVTGWLLVLCLLLTFMYPTTSLYCIFSYTIPNLIHADTTARTILLGVYSVLFIAVAVFSFLAGLKLWLVKPSAVRFARIYLMTYLGANIAYFLFWVLIVRPTQVASLVEMGWYHVVSPIPSVALWYFYLEHSKRVWATYRHRPSFDCR
jgi:hypothetical protein